MSGRNVQSRMAIQEEAERLLDFLSSNPHGICSAVREVVKEMMLETDGRLSVQGSPFDIIAKQLGGGVYRLTLKNIKRGEP